MNKQFLKTVNIITLLILVILLNGCATKPGPNLASKATLIHPQITTKDEVLKFLGPPGQIFTSSDGKEEWYYYYKIKSFWAKVPIVKNYCGKNYTEVLKIVIKGNRVIDCLYYTVTYPKKR